MKLNSKSEVSFYQTPFPTVGSLKAVLNLLWEFLV